MTSNPDDFSFYSNVINLIKGGSKIFNICIFQKDGYIEKTNSVCYPYTPACTLFVIAEVIRKLALNIIVNM